MKSKNTRFIAAFLFSIIFIASSQAQFLKKLKNRVEKKVEDVVVEKTANKAAEKTSKSMDKVFEANPFGGVNQKKADPANVPNAYDFSWKYTLKMTTKEGDMVFDYYLEPGAPYFGFSSIAMDHMFTVMDNGRKLTVIFMETQGNNLGMANQMPDDLDVEEMKDQSGQFTFEQLPDKTIMGYHCKGVKATNDEFETEMYFTNEAEVSFDDIYKNQQTKIPVQLKNYFKLEDKVLMISMDMRSLKNHKRDAHIECVGLEKISKTIKKSDYKFM
ncbi:MAG: DUF4412 domain-containing protein [Gelidibacter sp.]